MVLVGPEILAGSTRLKAGTAQKLVLNTISTVAMIRLGKTYAGLMVGVVAANEKLRERVRRIVSEATGAPSEAIDAALAAADGDPRVAIVSLLAGVDARLCARPARGRGRQRARGARPVKLDVAAALVDGRLVPGRVEIVDGLITGYGLSGGGRGIAAPGFVDLQVNGFGGVDFLEADGDGYRRAGEALLETGVTAFLPTLITAPEETLRRRAGRDPGERGRHGRAGARRPPRGPVPFRLAPGHAPAGRPARPRRRPPRAAARGRPGSHHDARSRAPRRARADRHSRRARRGRLVRPHGRVGGAGGARIRPRRAHGDAPLQRDAPVHAPGPRHRRRGARTKGRDRADHRRRHPPGARDHVA